MPLSADTRSVERRALHAIPGLLETGLFLDRRAAIAIEGANGVVVREP